MASCMLSSRVSSSSKSVAFGSGLACFVGVPASAGSVEGRLAISVLSRSDSESDDDDDDDDEDDDDEEEEEEDSERFTAGIDGVAGT